MDSYLLYLLFGVALIVALALLAVRLRAIDASGAGTGAAISFLAFLAGGFIWLLTIVIFFAVSSGMTRYRYDYKRKLGVAQEKGGVRSWKNSIANGGVSAVASIGELYTHSELFAVLFLASVASAMSDTLATEVGLLSHSGPRLITNIRKVVEPGTSGGVSGLGAIAAFLSALGMSLFGVSIFPSSVEQVKLLYFGAAVLAGTLVGVFSDSLLGATVQAQNQCTICGDLTEAQMHHGRPVTRLRGLKYVDNNVVNLGCTLIGGLAAVLLALALHL